MFAFLTRILGGAVAGTAIRWVAAAGIAAAVTALGFGLIEYGISLRAAKVQEQLMEQTKINRERNFTVDRSTISKDAALTLKLQEIEQTWGSKPLPQDSQPSPF